MAITTFSSREFNQDTSRAKKAALLGPVFITDRGKPSFVLISTDEYRRLTHQKKNLAELLYMPGADEIEFDVPKLSGDLMRPADFS